MKKISAIFAVLIAVLFTGVFALAQSAGVDIPAPATSVSDVISALTALIGGVQGASTLAIVALVGQLLAKFVLSPLWENLKLDPKYKFLVFALTSLIGSVVPLMIQGQSFLQAISGGAVLLLVVQYGHRIYELFIEDKKA